MIFNHALSSLLNADEDDKNNLDPAASSKRSQPSRNGVSVVLMGLYFYRILILSVIGCGIGLKNRFWLSKAPFWKYPSHDNFAQLCFPL